MDIKAILERHPRPWRIYEEPEEWGDDSIVDAKFIGEKGYNRHNQDHVVIDSSEWLHLDRDVAELIVQLVNSMEYKPVRTYEEGVAAGLETAARYTENQAKLHAERLGEVGEEPYLSDRARWTAGHIAGIAKALRERAEWEKKRSKTIEREGK